jgi:multiple sugar transport system substrate-binding protein
VLQQMSSKTLPDVLVPDNPNLQQFASVGALKSLTSLGVSTSNFSKSILTAGSYKGTVYGLAPTVASIALFYNKDLLAAKKVTPPTTWAELKADALKLTSGSQYGLALSAVGTSEGTWTFLPFMWSDGGNEKNITDSGTVAGLQLWTDMVEDGSISKGSLNWTQADVNDQFIAGKAAMMVNGPWQIPSLKAATSLHYGVVNIPVPKAGDPAVVPLGGPVWTVPNTGKTASEQKAAQVVKCMTDSANQLKMAKEQNSVPASPAAAAKYAATVPSMAAFAAQVSNARSRTGELGANWPKTETALYTAIQAALTGESSPLQALKAASSGN